MRIYVLVTCFEPLKIYMFKEGLVRFATQKYSNNPKTLEKRFIHLTNYSVNKRADDYVKATDKAFFEQIDLERFEAGDEDVDAKVVLEAVDQVWVGNILADDVAIFPGDCLLRADDLNAFAAARSGRFHNVH